MSTEAFDRQSLTEKLSKLNNSQQSIESLSRWCITHRKKAKQIVETWDQIFNSSQKEQQVSFLYLANDILQNSRRKGSEFVNEFWKFLPAALKHVYGNGDESGKRVVSRLVGIWEERKVFGSRGQSLKDVMVGNEKDLPIPVSNGKSSNPIKIMKRDAHSIRIKLAVGGMPEKVLMAFQAVLDENVNEEAILSKCSSTVKRIGEIEDCDNISNPGEHQGSALADELNEQESVLKQCVKELESVEDSRSALVSLLREALKDQESKLEVIHAQLQVARGRIERASNKRKRATLSPVRGSPVVTSDQQAPSILPQPPSSQPVTSFVPVQITEEEKKKAAAAAMAAKLAASTSSAQMLTSVLSSLVAEEAAHMNGGLQPPGFGFPMFSSDKRAKLEKPMSVSDVGHSDPVNTSYMQIQSSVQMSQPIHLQAPFQPPPPPGLPTLANPPSNQFVQSAGMMVGVMPYGFGANNTLPPPPPPPPLPPHIAMGLSRPAPQQSASQSPQSQHQQQQLQQQQQQQLQQQQQQPATGGYYRPPGIGFYGQNHQSATNEFRS